MFIIDSLLDLFNMLLGQVLSIPLENTLSQVYTFLNIILLALAGLAGG